MLSASVHLSQICPRLIDPLLFDFRLNGRKQMRDQLISGGNVFMLNGSGGSGGGATAEPLPATWSEKDDRRESTW